jgi:hypothetical protein
MANDWMRFVIGSKFNWWRIEICCRGSLRCPRTTPDPRLHAPPTASPTMSPAFINQLVVVDDNLTILERLGLLLEWGSSFRT